MGKLLRFPKRNRVSPGDQFWNWLRYGIDRGWVSEPVCPSHEGVPLTESESARHDDGEPVCVDVVRLWKLT